jgi:hypothetical protein
MLFGLGSTEASGMPEEGGAFGGSNGVSFVRFGVGQFSTSRSKRFGNRQRT